MTSQAEAINENLEKAQVIINDQQQTIVAHETRIQELEARTEELELKYEALSIGYVHLRDDFNKFKEALGIEDSVSLLDPDSKIARTTTYIKAPKNAATGGGGGASPASVKADVDQQNRLLALAQNFSGADVNVPEITEDDIRFATTTFASTFDALISDIETGTVTPEQLDDLRNGIITGTETNLNSLLSNLVVPRLDNIDAQTTDRRQINNTKTGLCESLNGGFCPTTPGNPNPTQGLQGMNNNIANQGNAINTALGAANLEQGQSILGIVKDTNDVINHKDFGLKKVQEYASIAWKATRADKILGYLSLAASIHNGAMLSRNLGGSLGDIISAVANNTISLIKNEEFQEIDINTTLGNTIEGFLKSLIGAENYTGASETLAKYNRIINAASNVIYSITSIQAGLAEGLETIGNYTGKIGNALKKSGAVLETSYNWMSEKTSVKTGRLGKIQRVINFGESAENVGSDIQNATEEFRDAQENVTNINNQFNQVKGEFTTTETETTELETTAKVNSQGSQPELVDFVRDPIEDEN